MKAFIDNLILWIKSNWLMSLVIFVVAVLILFPKVIGRLFRKKPVRHRKSYYRNRTLPRSVGIRRRNKLAVYGKNGKVKKPWQVKGSEAARRHMAKIRRMR